MKGDVKKFTVKLLIFLLPLGIIPAVYIALDPFKVIKHYNSYINSDTHNYVGLNKDFISTQTFLNYNPTHNYNSFIFGSSRSMCYRISEWQKYIGPESCFHFDASAESIFGISKKVEMLHKQHVKIKNALIILDYSVLANAKNSTGHLYIKHPLLTGGVSIIPFEMEFFKAFIDYQWLTCYFDYKLNHQVNRFYKILDDQIVNYTPEINEVKWLYQDSIIAADSNNYYNVAHKGVFYDRDTTKPKISKPILKEEHKELMENMAKIFAEDGTNYKIIISPVYDQYKFDPRDMAIIQSVFGAKNVYDFSGVNDITNNKYNYYEASHYRPFIASRIMQYAYSH